MIKANLKNFRKLIMRADCIIKSDTKKTNGNFSSKIKNPKGRTKMSNADSTTMSPENNSSNIRFDIAIY